MRIYFFLATWFSHPPFFAALWGTWPNFCLQNIGYYFINNCCLCSYPYTPSPAPIILEPGIVTNENAHSMWIWRFQTVTGFKAFTEKMFNAFNREMVLNLSIFTSPPMLFRRTRHNFTARTSTHSAIKPLTWGRRIWKMVDRHLAITTSHLEACPEFNSLRNANKYSQVNSRLIVGASAPSVNWATFFIHMKSELQLRFRYNE